MFRPYGRSGKARILKFLFVLIGLLVGALPLFPQSNLAYGELHGSVADPAGAMIPGAKVTLKLNSTGVQREVTTSAEGEFRFLLVQPGRYDLRVEKDGFRPVEQAGFDVSVGQDLALDFTLSIGELLDALTIEATPPSIESSRSQQASFLGEQRVHDLPINRRDFLSFVLLTPGVVDSKGLADNADMRVKQTPASGLSFFGSNGRGNSVTIDGGEMNEGGGGVRSAISQEAVQEFQINRGNFNAEIGGASGGAINIVSRGGTNDVHGSVFGFFRHDSLDAGDPFARVLQNEQLVRIKPPSQRQQFGASVGLPLVKDRTFLFAAFEQLRRRESSVVSILTDLSIFEPTPQQELVLQQLPPAQAAALRRVLTASPATRELFQRNSGVFPFETDGYKSSLRLDHTLSPIDQLFLRFDVPLLNESNANLEALVGATRGLEVEQFDPTALFGWTRVLSPSMTNELRLQACFRRFNVETVEKFGPEFRIAGYGIFNRDIFLPSRNIERRFEIRDNVSVVRGRHLVKFGTQILIRSSHSDSEVFVPGRFTFGSLPASVLSPALPASLPITALQSFNLGLAQTYVQGVGDSVVAAIHPYYGFYLQDSWRPTPHLTLDLGLRYELDTRKSPLPRDANNFAPRFGFAWSFGGDRPTVLRGGYGIYYSPVYFSIDWTVNALNEIDGRRQIAQTFSSILTPGIGSAPNIFSTLLRQGVISVPTPSRSIRPEDLTQFGISFPHTGPLPPFSVLFQNSADFVNPYAQQASLSIQREIARGLTLEIGGLFARTLKVSRARDSNLLPAPVDPRLGIRVWSNPAYFVDPLLAQRNVFESTARAWYSGLTAEVQKRFSRTFDFNGNYTYSKAIDDVVDYNSDFEATDQTNLAAERALSSFHQTHKVVLYGTWRGPAGIALSPIFRANSGRPFNLIAGFDLNQDRHDSTDRPVFAGRNTGRGPAFWTFDLRFAKSFTFSERWRAEFMAEGFNLLNHLNLASVNNTVGNMPGPFRVTGRHDRTPNQPLGFTSAFEARKIQLGFRLSF